ncbi:MAG TPA: hypothetical protein VH416_07710 [Gaiellaceae bacterium]
MRRVVVTLVAALALALAGSASAGIAGSPHDHAGAAWASDFRG